MSKTKDMTGQRFGMLVVLRREGSNSDGLALWRCRCDCGNECVVAGANMRKGNTKSCGCMIIKSTKARMTTHGKSQTRLYAVWKAMIQRCCNPADKNYNRYGGRGISICREWKNDYLSFYKWAMANGYNKDAPVGQCTIDRINNDKGYSPDNCRWVDLKTQQNNKSKRSKTNDCN